MNNRELDLKFGAVVKTERKITLEILEMIRLAEHQRLPLELGFQDTYDWLIRGHGYSGSAANRIQAARLLNAVPEAAPQVETGALNLTTLWQTQKAIRTQQKASGEKVSVEQKREALSKISGKTSEAAARELNLIFPDADTFVEKTVHKHNGGVGLSLQFTEEEIRELERAKELLSHAMPGPTMAQIIVRLARENNDRNDPLRKQTRQKDPLRKKQRQTATPDQLHLAPTPQRSTTSARRDTIRKARGCCTFVNPVTGRVCGSRYQPEADHIVPKVFGGTDNPENLRCFCRKHNQWMAEKALGRKFMELRRAEKRRT